MSNDKNWMSLADVVRVKKIADSINFMRLFYLKSSSEQLEQIKLERGFSTDEKEGLEIIDCVMAIFFFEITRLFRQGKSLYSKD